MSDNNEILHIPKRLAQVAGVMERLASDPPQVLLLEGGTAEERSLLGGYWATMMACAEGDGACGECVSCRQACAPVTWFEDGKNKSNSGWIFDQRHADIFSMDGRDGNIKIEPIRELKPFFGQPPRGDGRRVVLFHEAQKFTPSAANALLKVLEEPGFGTVFVLLAAHRERLLPTLVSRSWVLTLPWPQDREETPETVEWLKALASFWRDGRGWFARTTPKGAVDKDVAMGVLLACQREYVRALTGRVDGPLSGGFARLAPERLRRVEVVLGYAQDALSLQTPVNPVLVLDWMATRIHGVLRGV